MKITAQQFDELKQQTDLAAVLKAVGVEVEDEAWPKKDDVYWFVDDGGGLGKVHWDGGGLGKVPYGGDRIDLYRQSLNNVHRTREDAEHYKATTIRRWQAECAIRNWRDKHCPFEVDWEDKGQQKWFNYFDHHRKGWNPAFRDDRQQISEIYFATEADAKACLEALPCEWEVLRAV
jgi:hypothetical protein